MDDNTVRRLREWFNDWTGREPAGVWSAPGRVNLIGEHTDYNDGLVAPLAIGRRTIAAVGPREDRSVHVTSTIDGAHVRRDIPTRCPASATRPPPWADYILGVLWALREAGLHLPGLDIAIDSDVPVGAGLSSSAALECVVALAANDLCDGGLSRMALARAARRAENEYVGVPSGGMDQVISMLGEAGHLLAIDTADWRVTPVPLDLAAAGLILLVMDTGVTHAVAGTGYRTRVRECRSACDILGVTSLREVESMPEPGTLPAPLDRRVSHVVTENQRVREAVAALSAGADPRELATILTASHASLATDYEVSCPELDLAVASSLAAGAHGARMTGAGFGGSAIALVDRTQAGQVAEAVGEAAVRAGYEAPRCFTADPAPGARRVDPPLAGATADSS